MPLLYVNNFRGFHDTYLPLKSVNFFVGENSTGKTSILKLIRILSDYRFWFSLDFDNEENGLGYFSEIADDQDFFEVGILNDLVDKNNKIKAIKIKFLNNEGTPAVSQIRTISSKYDIDVVKSQNKIQYRYQTVRVDNNNYADEEYFQSWIEHNTLGNKQYDEIKTKEDVLPGALFSFHNFIEDVIEEVKNEEHYFKSFAAPQFLKDIIWLAPVRAKPRRTYDNYRANPSPEGLHTPYLLKNLLSKENKSKDHVEKILGKFGSDSGLFEKVDVHSLGEEKTSPFEIWIYLNNKPHKISNVGYGVSQTLPLVIEILARHNDAWFAIQQPEIHLHPKAQAAFGEFVYKTYVTEEKNFIIETHSDFIIDRFRLRVSKDYDQGIKHEDKFQVVFFQKSPEGNQLTCIPILPDGTYPEHQPESFKDFFIKEQLDLLKI